MSEPPFKRLVATDPSARDDPAEQLWQRWRRGQRPDVDNFLAQAGPLSPDQVAAVLRVDQRERWQAGERVLVETYLDRHPVLRAHPETALDLVYHEILLREQREEPPSVEEYLQRFPEHAAVLRPQIQLHQALGPDSALGHVTPAQLSGESAERNTVAAAPVPNGPDAWPAVAGYAIVRELGRGGMGVVYEARHLRLKRVVALKMLLAGPQAGPEQLARFRAEAETVARLQHPNIVQIYEVGEHDGRPYVALEYVAGGNLDKRLAGTPQPARVAAPLVETVARAVHVAHEHGIVHRDLKPANILLTTEAPRHREDTGEKERKREGQAEGTGSAAILSSAAAARCLGVSGVSCTPKITECRWPSTWAGLTISSPS
jgi:hypothetical protein